MSVTGSHAGTIDPGALQCFRMSARRSRSKPAMAATLNAPLAQLDRASVYGCNRAVFGKCCNVLNCTCILARSERGGDFIKDPLRPKNSHERVSGHPRAVGRPTGTRVPTALYPSHRMPQELRRRGGSMSDTSGFSRPHLPANDGAAGR
jgi:hypothetical protein